MKNMLYKEQLQAIQDDLIPFGFISNPADDQPVVEVGGDGTRWIVQN
jgi:hypothetical protein